MKKLIAILLVLTLLVVGLVSCNEGEGEGDTTTTTPTPTPSAPSVDPYDPPALNGETPGIELPSTPITPQN